MLKYVYVFIAGIMLTGAAWYGLGRNNLSEVRQNLDRLHRDFEEVQRNSDSLRTDSGGFAGDIAVITETGRRIEDRAGRIEAGFTELDGGLGISIGKVDELSGFNRELIRIGRDIGDLAFDLRRISEESRKAE